MNLIAFCLVLFSTFTHAYWNYLLKNVKGGIHFVWIFTVLTSIIYMPVFIYNGMSIGTEITADHIYIFAGSILFHLLYFILLDKAYFFGDLSVIYPVTRGVAPVFTILFATFFLNEHISMQQSVSIALILAGTFALSGFQIRKKEKNAKALIFALLCGLMVTGYTLIDKAAVSTFAIAPYTLDFFNNIGRSIALSPVAFSNWKHTKQLFKTHYKRAIYIAVLSPFSYVLVLFAMRLAPISLISPLRQLSIVISGILGIRLLYESKNIFKLAGIFITFLGVVGLCL